MTRNPIFRMEMRFQVNVVDGKRHWELGVEMRNARLVVNPFLACFWKRSEALFTCLQHLMQVFIDKLQTAEVNRHHLVALEVSLKDGTISCDH